MPKKLSQEEVEKRIQKICKERNYILLENFKYKNGNTRIKLKCNKDGYEWSPTIHSLNYKGCPKCGGSLKKNKNDVFKEIINKCKKLDYTLLKFNYKNTKSKIKLKCNKDDYEWSPNVSTFLNEKYVGCKRCLGIEKYSIKKIKDILNKYCLKYNYKYELTIYNSNNSKIKLKCNKDGYEWFTNLNDILRDKTHCSRCSNNEKINQEDAEKRVQKICNKYNYSFKPFKYKNKNTKIKLKCNKDGYEWSTTFYNIKYEKFGCKRCSKKEKISQEYAEKRVQKICKERNYKLVKKFKYENNKTILTIKCLKHNYIWDVAFRDFMRYSGCLLCSSSKGELKIKNFLEEKNINFDFQKKFKDCKDKRELPFDFYLPDYNLCIEYDGVQHFESIEYFGNENDFKIRQRHDKIKNQYCKRNNIGLLRIKYNNYNNIKNILNEKLKIII